MKAMAPRPFRRSPSLQICVNNSCAAGRPWFGICGLPTPVRLSRVLRGRSTTVFASPLAWVTRTCTRFGARRSVTSCSSSCFVLSVCISWPYRLSRVVARAASCRPSHSWSAARRRVGSVLAPTPACTPTALGPQLCWSGGGKQGRGVANFRRTANFRRRNRLQRRPNRLQRRSR